MLPLIYHSLGGSDNPFWNNHLDFPDWLEQLDEELLLANCRILCNHQVSDHYGLHLALGREPDEMSKHQKAIDAEGIVFFSEDGEAFQSRTIYHDKRSDRSYPRYDAGKGGQRVFFPSVPPEYRERMRQRGFRFSDEGDFWEQVKAEPKIPLFDCEGAAKALAMIQLGYPAYSGYGAFGCVVRKEKLEGGGELNVPHHLVPELGQLMGKGRVVYLVPDQDINPKTRDKVFKGFEERVALMENRGAIVRILQWDSALGKGIDDVIAHVGGQSVESLIRDADCASAWRMGNYLKRLQVSSSYTLSVNSASMGKEDLSKVPTSGILICDAPMGTGKTETIAQITKGRTLLSPYSLRSLARSAAERIDAEFLNECTEDEGFHYGAGEVLADRLTLCYDSLFKIYMNQQFGGKPPQDLVLDEASSGLRHLLLGETCKRNRVALFAAFCWAVRAAERIIVFDADLLWTDVDLIKSIRGEDTVCHLKNSYRPTPWPATLIKGCNNIPRAIAHALEEVRDTLKRQPHHFIHFATDSKNSAKTISHCLAGMGIKALLVCAETTNNPDYPLVKDLLANEWSEIKRQGYQVIVTSPSISTGVSWEQDHFSLVVGLFTGQSVRPQVMMQSLGRVRKPVPRLVWASSRSRGKLHHKGGRSRILHAQEVNYRVAAGLAGVELPPTNEVLDLLNLSISSLTSIDNGWSRDPLASLTALLRHRGCNLSFVEVGQTNTLEDVKMWRKEYREAELLSVFHAAVITDKQAERLTDKSKGLGISTQEQVELKRYRAAVDWAVDGEALSFEQLEIAGGIRRKLHRLDGLETQDGLTEADEITAESITGVFSDVDTLRAEVALLRHLRLSELIRLTQDRQIKHDDAELLELYRWWKTQTNNIKAIFNTATEKMSPIQFAQTLLGFMGLRLTLVSRSAKGRFYTLDMHRYELLQSACVRHRSKARQKSAKPLPVSSSLKLPPPRVKKKDWAFGVEGLIFDKP